MIVGAHIWRIWIVVDCIVCMEEFFITHDIRFGFVEDGKETHSIYINLI